MTEKADGQTQKPATDSYVILSNLKKSRKERRVKTISEINSTDYQIESQSEGLVSECGYKEREGYFRKFICHGKSTSQTAPKVIFEGFCFSYKLLGEAAFITEIRQWNSA